MSEYIEIETEMGEDGRTLHLTTNLRLAEAEPESYETVTEMEEGSAVAQALAVVEGIETLLIDGRTLTLTCHPDADWHIIVADVTAVLKDFFL